MLTLEKLPTYMYNFEFLNSQLTVKPVLSSDTPDFEYEEGLGLSTASEGSLEEKLPYGPLIDLGFEEWRA